MIGRKAFAMCGVLVLTALLAGCGGSSSVSPAAYAKSVCTATAPLEKKLLSERSLGLSRLSPAQAKKALQGFFKSIAADSDHALSQLNSAGTPNVKNGKAISGAIVGAFTQLKGSLSQAASQTGTLPTSSAKRFRTAAAQLGSGVRLSMASITTSLSGLKSPALQKAAKSTPACQKLGA